MRVAVLGAGLAGSCVALELADAGFDVHLFERAEQALSGASMRNEGKIHLGLVYANDASGRTAQAMVHGAASFEPLLGRWLEPGCLNAVASAPYIYAVPHDSLLPVDAIRQHFIRVSRLWDSCTQAGGGGRRRAIEAPLWQERKVGAGDALFDPRKISHAFTTRERAVDPFLVCAALRARVEHQPGLSLRCRSEITSVARASRGGFRVHFRHDDTAAAEPFDIVVNALWEQRLAIDRTLDPSALVPPVVHRYKFALRCEDAAVVQGMPTVTFVLGAYGDSVAYPDAIYASWYPAGLLRQEFTIKPSRAPIELSAEAEQRLIDATLAGLRAFMPGAADVLQPERGHWRPFGGYVTAWGATGIEDVGSELHQRHAVGVHCSGDYYSIDTGKFSTAPMFAAQACACIRQREVQFA